MTLPVGYSTTTRTIDRMVSDKRLPPPDYLFGGETPFWNEAKLDENDRAATLRPKREPETTEITTNQENA